jgi:hypothetical protein
MRKSSWTPSIVPGGHDETVYMVMEHLGQLGTIWVEADVGKPDLETIIVDLLDGQYKNPIGIIAFNTAEQWSRNVSEDVALELRRHCDFEGRELPESVRDFVERHARNPPSLTLRLVRPA